MLPPARVCLPTQRIPDQVARRVIPSRTASWSSFCGTNQVPVRRPAAWRFATYGSLSQASVAHTTDAGKAYLRALVPAIPLQIGDLRVRLVHGSPRRVNEYLYEDRPDSSLERLRDLAEADVLVCGHTHIPYHQVLPSGRHVVNAGSVGKPKDGDPRAGYIVLGAVGGELQVEFVRVPYDVERAARAIEASAMPHEYAAMLRTGAG
ncbi:MAG: metallophosphoesterase family protein [Candidatus Dormibacteraeota bacterium]|nr:metallophosphoesterase family protein [Candidatus Dormibacteraeota bacterium]